MGVRHRCFIINTDCVGYCKFSSRQSSRCESGKIITNGVVEPGVMSSESGAGSCVIATAIAGKTKQEAGSKSYEDFSSVLLL